jgi:hypothetical protein
MLMRQPETLPVYSHNAIKKKIDSDYTANQSIWQTYWTEASLDTRLEAGDTTLMAELNTTLPNNGRGAWSFNRVRPLCNMVSGHQRRNRKSTIVVPLENGDQQTADQITKAILNIYKREGIYETISDAFHQGACITGMNLLHLYLDYTNDPISGDIKVDNCAYNSFMIDPYFRKTDLSDCSFVWRRSYMSHREATSIMPPEYYERIMSLPGNPTGTGRDGRFQYMPESFGMTQQNRISYDEYYYRDSRLQKRFVDRQTGEYMEINTASNIDIERFLATYPQVMLEEKEVPTVRLAIMIQGEVFYDGPNPLGIDEFPFVPVMGYYNPMMPQYSTRIQGICRSLRDPQLLYNRRVILSADAAESVINSGYIFKIGAVLDMKHLYQTGQGRTIPVKDDCNIATDIVPIAPPNIPQYFFELQDTFSKEMNMVSGINEELMGSALDDKAGILSALRQGAGLTTLQPIFDKLDYSQVLLGNRVLSVMQNNYTPGKIQNILEGEKPAPLFYNKAFGKYHCMVEEGFNTQSQKQMQFAQLIQLREIGLAIPDSSLIDAATLQNKDKIIQQMEQQQQQQQQLQQQQQQAVIADLQSRAMANEGLGIERASRVDENKALGVERRAKAVADDQMALLNFAKALKEMETIDINHLQTIITLQQVLKAQTEQTNENNPQPIQNGSA